MGNCQFFTLKVPQPSQIDKQIDIDCDYRLILDLILS